LTSRSDQRFWIVKLPGQEYPEMAEVEAATMSWAKAAGHEVPTNFAFPSDRIDSLPAGWTRGCPTAYAIERFDRRPNGTRIHHEDFCQALELLPDHKLGDSGKGFSLDGALRLVGDSAGEDEAVKFARRVGFIIASGNSDAHLKNWSFVWGGAERPSLSPCYDFVATVTWPDFGWDHRHGPSLALSLGRVRRFKDLDQAALARHSAKADRLWAQEAIMEGIAAARAAWPHIESTAPAAMRRAIRRHWRKVPVLVSAGPLKWSPPD
jgi:serine/threonine-protein kinase HipA